MWLADFLHFSLNSVLPEEPGFVGGGKLIKAERDVFSCEVVGVDASGAEMSTFILPFS